MANSKVSELTEISVPALEDLFYTVDDPSGTPVGNKLTAARLGGLIAHAVCQGRLTTESGVPVSTSDRSSQGTLYYTPFTGNNIALYDGTRWKFYVFTELSLALTLTSGKNYDVFVYDNSGTLTIELSAAWTDDTTRADALTLQDSVYVKSGATTRRWVGTIRASGANVTADALAKRFVWNADNQVLRGLYVADGTASWSYTTGTYRIANGGTTPTNCVEFVCGSPVHISAQVTASVYLLNNNARAAKTGIGVNSSTVNSGLNTQAFNHDPTNGTQTATMASYRDLSRTGYSYLSWLEFGADDTSTFLGTDGPSGMHATITA